MVVLYLCDTLNGCRYRKISVEYAANPKIKNIIGAMIFEIED